MRAGTARIPLIPLILLALAAAGDAAAQAFPEKPIRIVVPFAPGGNIDITARALAPGLSAALGVSVIVDNRGGAAGTIGMDMVVKSPPDGYTLVVGSTGTVTAARALYAKLPYDPMRDLVAIAPVTDAPVVMVVHPAMRARGAAELVTYARGKAGHVTMGSAGAGSTNHLAGELFQFRTGVKFTHIPYKGSGPALVDLMGGQIDVYFDQLTASLGYIRAGKLRALGIAQPKRSALIAEVATFAEQGIRDAEASTFTGIYAPAATPRAVVDRLNAAITKVVATPAVHERFAALGAEVRTGTADQFAQVMQEDFAKWSRVVKEAGIRLEL